ncbi:MAG TPA: cyanophycin synthetase [Bacteroidia bacterium]|jgi:cyanophycin synthetase
MKILETKIMRGPNYWSGYRKNLIVLKLDIGELELLPTNNIPGFSERLEQLMPSLFTHCCSENEPGGFFRRVKRGTWMGHVVEHIALELQTLAGMDCGYGRTRESGTKGVYYVVFSYKIEKAGVYAGEAAVRIADALVKGEHYSIDADIERLRELLRKYSLGPSTQAIVDEAEARKIPVKRLNNGSLVVLGQGIHQKKVRAAILDSTSCIGVETASDKEDTKRLLSQAYVPVPEGLLVNKEEELPSVTETLNFPLAVKPLNGNHGRGVTTNILNAEQLLAAFHLAQSISYDVIVEEHISGTDHRLLVVNHKLVAAAKRIPAQVTGDGVSTITQLVEFVNMDPARGYDHESHLTKIKLDESALKALAKKNLGPDSVPAPGETVCLKDTANLSTGGTAIDVTDKVHPHIIFMAERISRLLNLNVCGIDLLVKDIEQPLTKENGRVLEVNASPGLRMHLSPSEGNGRNVAAPIIDMLFPSAEQSRIPVVAITGTNGKTTTTRLVAHLMRTAGKNVGYTTTDGVYIGEHLIRKGDCTGPLSAEAVLLDPTVDFAVLECARGGIIRSGLGFDECDISIITNITEDHLGLEGIDTLEQLTEVKSIVAKNTRPGGYAILNADDDRVYGIRLDIVSHFALFSMDANSERIRKHCARGGTAAVIEDGWLTICEGRWKKPIIAVASIPLTYGGRAECMIKNILPSALAAHLLGLSPQMIKNALEHFEASPQLTPGRMNLFSFRNFELMIDYAHNIDGFSELEKFMAKTPATLKVGIIAAPGDRKDSDIFRVGQLSAKIFDEIIIRNDKDLRGRTAKEISDLLIKGIQSVKPGIGIKQIEDAGEAMQYAINNAHPGSFIFMSTEYPQESIAFAENALRTELERPEKKNGNPIGRSLILKAS